MTTKQIKVAAKATLKGYWLRAIVVFATIEAVSAVATFVAMLVALIATGKSEAELAAIVTIIGGVGGVLLTAPLQMGYKRILWLLTEGEIPSVAVMFDLFGQPKRLFKCYALTILKGLAIGLPFAIGMAPSVVVEALLERGYALPGQLQGLEVVFSAVGSVLSIIGLVVSMIMTIKLFFSEFIFISGDEVGAIEAITRSSELSNGKKGAIITLVFSFIHWFLLGATGIGNLYAAPYFAAASAVFTRSVIARDEYMLLREAEV